MAKKDYPYGQPVGPLNYWNVKHGLSWQSFVKKLLPSGQLVLSNEPLKVDAKELQVQTLRIRFCELQTNLKFGGRAQLEKDCLYILDILDIQANESSYHSSDSWPNNDPNPKQKIYLPLKYEPSIFAKARSTIGVGTISQSKAASK